MGRRGLDVTKGVPKARPVPDCAFAGLGEARPVQRVCEEGSRASLGVDR
jgi:hypothetical protein